MTRKNVSVGNLSESFTAVAVLTLAGKFLQQFVGNHQFRSAIVYIEASVVFGGPLQLHYPRKSAAAAAIRDILLDGRVEKPIRSHSVACHTKRRLSPAVSQR